MMNTGNGKLKNILSIKYLPAGQNTGLICISVIKHLMKCGKKEMTIPCSFFIACNSSATQGVSIKNGGI